ncbi:hypothetical protein ACFX13_024491 [Malus domestica]
MILNDGVHNDDDVSSDPFKIFLSQPQESSGDPFNFLSQEDSPSRSAYFDSDPYVTKESSLKRLSLNGVVSGRSKKTKTQKEAVGKNSYRPPPTPSILATSTLMEAQGFGEMMEPVDEVNFTLDGLRKGQPVRIKRASLLSLLSIYGTTQQTRLLRTQGYYSSRESSMFVGSKGILKAL